MAAKSYAQIVGANERVHVGILGFGLIGRVHTRTFHALRTARITAVSDAFAPRMDACRAIVPDAKKYADFRALLDSKETDAVVVAPPDHWHALHTMLACAAGKDVYVEKPTHLFVREGEWMQTVAAKYRRVVQVGTQQRSGPHYQRAKQLLLEGAIGELVSVQCDFLRNVMPGIGSPADGPAPAGLDWEMFLGPSPQRRYNVNRSLYHFRWFWETAGGQMTNLGHHSLDIAHWMFDLAAPQAVSSAGGRWFLKDNGETPDTQDTILEYEKFPVVVQIREAGGNALAKGSLVFIGTKGTMTLGRSGFEIIPDKKVHPRNIFAGMIGADADGGHPIGGPQPIDETKGQKWCEPQLDKTGNASQQYTLHAENFIDCIKTRKMPISDLKSSHWVSTSCHLANISLRTGRKIVWDSAANSIAADPEASAFLERSYREPWASQLKQLLT